ncbi:MAG: cob(I)yrinic acid a,c-diamide adenosyltransferase [Gammaproteobacteria bacterium]|nr:cob(I)yrinic acid a,c-diamide adenosyltransferase [Gammaproteobacteria bacterium]
MGHRLSKIYTRTGDDGTTGLGDGTRVRKDAIQVEAYGTVDELNSHLGVVLAQPLREDVRRCLVEIQHDLFDLGGELCLPDHHPINQSYIERLERHIDRFNTELPPLKEFILPAGSLATAHCHVARAVCRRAERRLITLQQQITLSSFVLVYLNRLSDLLFVIARICARHDQGQEVMWQPGLNKPG